MLLVDARSGVVEQTRRHAAVLALLRVPRLVLAINKIDLVDYDEALLTAIAQGLRGPGPRRSGFTDAVTTIPVSALLGDNVVERSPHTPWYDGPRCCTTWSPCRSAGPGGQRAVPDPGAVRHPPRTPPTTAATRARSRRAPSRRATPSSCCPAGRRPPSPRSTPPTARWTPRAQAAASRSGWPTTSTSPAATSWPRPTRPTVTSELDATLCWLSDKPLRPGARLLVKHGTRTTQAIVGALGDRLDTDTVTWVDAPGQLAINDIARVTLRTADPLPVDDYAAIRATGSFLLIDPPTGNTLAAGLVGSPPGVIRRYDTARTSRTRCGCSAAPGMKQQRHEACSSSAPRQLGAQRALPGTVLVLGLQTAADRPPRRNSARNDRKHAPGPLTTPCCV